jgi:hypothetical protein
MGSDKQIRLKFKPRYREDAVIKPERVDEPEFTSSKAKEDDGASKMSVEPTNEEGDIVVEGGGFSLVNY